MNTFAFKCLKCGAVDYSNTTRRLSMRCPNGEFYPCKPDIFEKTYDVLEEGK